MAYCMRFLCYSLRTTAVRRVPLSRTIFGLRKPYLVPKAVSNIDLNEFKVFYSFPGIRLFCLISSAKMLRTSVILALSFMSYVAYRQDCISLDLFIMIILFGIYCMVAVYGTAYLSSNLIGKMYTNKSRSKIVISSLNIKGERVNKTFESNKVIMSDHPNFIARKYFKRINCSEENKVYNLYCYRGMKIDFGPFMKIFPNFE